MRTDQAVIDLMRSRRDKRADNRKLALILPGGGMNGVFSGGVAQALEEYGLSNVFDVIYGYSSGAATAAYLLSGNTKQGSSIYSEDLSGFSFFQPWRPYHWMNMPHMASVMRSIKPLDIGRINHARTLLNIQVTDADTGTTRFFSNRDEVDIIDVVVASCTFPGYAEPVALPGGRYCDGGVVDFMPIDKAIDEGCTDILVVATVPRGYQRPRIDINHFCASLFLRGYSQQFKSSFKTMRRRYNEYLSHLFSDDLPSGANIYILAPECFTSPMTTNPKKLRTYEQHGLQRARSIIGG